MARHYSRYGSIEEKRNIKKALRFLLLTVVTLVLLFFFGLPLVIKFAAFMTSIGKSTTPIEKADITPPAPPQLKNLPEATSETFLNVEGSSEAGATVSLFLNEKATEVVANEEGIFTSRLVLLDGENVLYAQAKDAAGNESQKTQNFTIIFDNKDPKLEISSPADGTTFSGSKNQRTDIVGVTDPETSLTINDKFVSVEDSGNFSFSVTLSEGDNTFNIKAQDAAENTTEKTLTLKYTP